MLLNRRLPWRGFEDSCWAEAWLGVVNVVVGLEFSLLFVVDLILNYSKSFKKHVVFPALILLISH